MEYSTIFKIATGLFAIHRLFYYMPSLIFQPKLSLEDEEDQSKDSKIYKIGHRGSSEGYPENSLAAFKHACDHGADIIEFDVWLTESGEVCVFHDPTLRRMVKGDDRKITEIGEGEQILLTDPDKDINGSQFDYISLITDDLDESMVSIPLFEDVLVFVKSQNPSLKMIIEFKMKSEELIEKVYGLLVKHEFIVETDGYYGEEGKRRRVIWFSLTTGVNGLLKIKNPSIPTITSVVALMKYAICHQIGILPFMDIKEEIVGLTLVKIDFDFLKTVPALKMCANWFLRFFFHFFTFFTFFLCSS